MAKTNYAERMRIPLEGHFDMPLYALNGDLIARGYSRVVIGGRGPYLEFTDAQIAHEGLVVPAGELWRLSAPYVYYDEWRNLDQSVKIYHQRKIVDYADYRIGFWYASPFHLKSDEFFPLIKELK